MRPLPVGGWALDARIDARGSAGQADVSDLSTSQCTRAVCLRCRRNTHPEGMALPLRPLPRTDDSKRKAAICYLVCRWANQFLEYVDIHVRHNDPSFPVAYTIFMGRRHLELDIPSHRIIRSVKESYWVYIEYRESGITEWIDAELSDLDRDSGSFFLYNDFTYPDTVHFYTLGQVPATLRCQPT